MKLRYLTPLLVLSFLSQTALAYDPLMDVDASDVQERVDQAVTALNELMSQSETSVPHELLKAAQCVANIRIYRLGIIVGGAIGHGLATCRLANGRWSAPLFLMLDGQGLGAQLGYEAIDMTLVSTKLDWLKEVSDGRSMLTASAGLAVGPLGADLRLGINDYAVENKVYAYTRWNGFFIGGMMEESGLIPDFAYNYSVYSITPPEDILLGRSSVSPLSPLGQPYSMAVQHYAK